MQCALLANSAGIGGGPFYVPLLTVVLGFDLKAATGLSHTIVGKLATPAACVAGMRVKLLKQYSRGTVGSCKAVLDEDLARVHACLNGSSSAIPSLCLQAVSALGYPTSSKHISKMTASCCSYIGSSKHCVRPDTDPPQ